MPILFLTCISADPGDPAVTGNDIR